MCGIAGFSLSSGDLSIVRPSNLAKHLALSIEHRGRDATGMSWTDMNGSVWYAKDNVKATDFVHAAQHQLVERTSATCIIHTRAATQGNPENNQNNHPILAGNIIGVHNGIIWNDDIVFNKNKDTFQRIAEVDSEIVFQLINAFGVEGLNQLEGDAAISWIDTENPDVMNIAALGGRPLVIAETVGGSLIFASEQACIENTVDKFRGLEINSITAITPGTHLTVYGGVITSWNGAPKISYQTPKKTAYQTGWTSVPPTQKDAPKSSISDSEMKLTIQHAFGKSIADDEGSDAYTKAVGWLEKYQPDRDFVGNPIDYEYDEFADFEPEFDPDDYWDSPEPSLSLFDDDEIIGDFPVTDHEAQARYQERMMDLVLRERGVK